MSKQSKENRIVFNRAQAGTLSLAILMALLLLVSTGCAKQPETQNNNNTGEPLISSKPKQQTEVVKLYFAGEQAMYLKPEIREIKLRGETLPAAVIRELIKGPSREDLSSTIPEQTKLLSFQAIDGVAYVNLSKEVRSEHWGGTTGEYMTVYSIVDTLADLRTGIEKVQFLVEGEKQETLVGHLGVFEPLLPDWRQVKSGEISVGGVEINKVKMETIQQQVDNGHQPWYLDPLQVAKETGTKFGFDPREDKFELLEVVPKAEYAGTGLAEVKAVHGDKEYIIQLIQPVKSGEHGIWAINSIRPK